MKNTILVFIPVLLFMACAIEKEEGPPEDILQLIDHETFEAKRRLWLDQDLRNYSFHIKIDIASQPNHLNGTVIVKDGALYAYIGNRFVPQGALGFIETISETYNQISDVYNGIVDAKYESGRERQRVYKQEIEYDDAYHFPKYYYYSSYDVYSDGEEIPIEAGSFGRMVITNFTLNPLDLEWLSFDRETFERERQLWLEKDLRDYSFSIRCESEETIREKSSYWSGKVEIRDGALFSLTYFIESSDPGWSPPPPDLEKWGTSISEIFNNINNDSLDNPGVNIGSPWRTEMRFWKEPGPGDVLRYEYRDYRCLLAQPEPSTEGEQSKVEFYPELFGLYKGFDLTIGHIKAAEQD
jgi:hypothetical protein